MRPRIIDYVKHPLSARQALAIAIECWSQSRQHPVILITPKGQADQVVKTIRVAFSREKLRIDGKVFYGFTTSNVFPYSVDGVKCEAMILRYRITRRQNLNQMNLLDDIKETLHGTV